MEFIEPPPNYNDVEKALEPVMKISKDTLPSYEDAVKSEQR